VIVIRASSVDVIRAAFGNSFCDVKKISRDQHFRDHAPMMLL